jgi:hypothetical protein
MELNALLEKLKMEHLEAQQERQAWTRPVLRETEAVSPSLLCSSWSP